MILLLDALPEGYVFSLEQQTLVQIAVHLINFVILAFVLAKLLYKPVRGFMHDRAQKLGKQIKRAEDEMARANALIDEYNEKLGRIETERDELLARARKAADEQRDKLLAQARAESETLRSDTLAYIDSEKKRALNEIKNAVAELSAAMAGKLIALSLDDGARENIFDETLAELRETVWPA